MAALIAKVIAVFQSSPNQNRIIGISGIDGSGKSTLASQLEQIVASNGIPVALINLDYLLHPRPMRHKQRDQIRGYFEDNFDYGSLVYMVMETAAAKTAFPSPGSTSMFQMSIGRSKLWFVGIGGVAVNCWWSSSGLDGH